MVNSTKYRFLIVVMLAYGCAEKAKQVKQQNHQFTAVVELLSKEGRSVISPEAQLDTLATGFDWTEGPLWVAAEKFLLFSDIPRNTVYKLDADGRVSPYLHPSGFSGKKFSGKEPGSNGLLLDSQQRLVLMQHGNRQVARMEAPLSYPQPLYATLTDNYGGQRFNSPNDGVFDAQGNLYFTDPPYGLPKLMDDSSKELDFQGVYCLLKDGNVVLVDDSLSRPNGIHISPDQKTLYVAVSDPKSATWYAYDIESPGTVSGKRLFYDVTELVGKPGEQGFPDGLKVNSKGIVFATGPGGIWIFNPAGEPLARIRIGQKTANCAFGPNEENLFITASGDLLSIPLK